MDEAYRIVWQPRAIRSLERIPEKVGAAAIEFIYGQLADNPHRVGKPLRRELTGLHCARRGDYRILYRIADHEVRLWSIDHRADAYR